MAIKFQYNKTSLQQLEKQLKVRVRTLPIIKNKESALRMEVKKSKVEAASLEKALENQISLSPKGAEVQKFPYLILYLYCPKLFLQFVSIFFLFERYVFDHHYLYMLLICQFH